MNQTGSVIVYRNPGEAAFWDLIMNDPLSVLAAMGIVTAFIVVVYVAYRIGGWWKNRDRTRRVDVDRWGH